MSNVRRGKVDLNNVSVLNSGLSKPRALLVSRKTVDSLEANVEKEVAPMKVNETVAPMEAEVIYTNRTPEPPLVNRGYLEEVRPVQEPVQSAIPEETPLVAGPSSNPINRVASRIVGFDVTGPTPVEVPQFVPQTPEVVTPTQGVAISTPVAAPELIETPRIVPVSQTTPRVIENSAMNAVPQSEVMPSYDMPQAIPTYQAPSYGISSANDPEGVVAAIDTRVATPVEPRREPMLQTPEEFQMAEPVEERKQDPLVEAAVAIEGTKSRIDEISNKFIEALNASNEEYKRSVAEADRRYNERLDAAQEEFKKSMLEENEKLNIIGNQIATVQTNNQRDSLSRVREAVNNQSDLLNTYNGGIYNVR